MVYFVVSVFLFAQGGRRGNIFIAKTYHLLGLVNPVSLSKFSLEFSFWGSMFALFGMFITLHLAKNTFYMGVDEIFIPNFDHLLGLTNSKNFR